ncbi:MAG: hypothetical protein IJV22_05405 [Bacteroidales bacterium]|nr:hypothetical protein [Bacteroidales bacterium]
MVRSNDNRRLAIAIVLALVVSFSAMANAVGLKDVPKLWPQVMATCAGAIVVVVVTMLLMRGQRVTEEEKEKSIKIHERKVEVYARFVVRMYKLLASDKMSCGGFVSLRTVISGSLIFYLSDKNRKRLLGELNGMRNICDEKEMVAVFARITCIQQDDWNGNERSGAGGEQMQVGMWSRFGDLALCSANMMSGREVMYG